MHRLFHRNCLNGDGKLSRQRARAGWRPRDEHTVSEGSATLRRTVSGGLGSLEHLTVSCMDPRFSAFLRRQVTHKVTRTNAVDVSSHPLSLAFAFERPQSRHMKPRSSGRERPKGARGGFLGGTTGTPRNLTFAKAVGQIWVGDCGRSSVPTDDRDHVHSRTAASESRDLALPTRDGH